MVNVIFKLGPEISLDFTGSEGRGAPLSMESSRQEAERDHVGNHVIEMLVWG